MQNGYSYSKTVLFFLTTLFVNWRYAQCKSILMQYFPTNLSSLNHPSFNHRLLPEMTDDARGRVSWCQESSAWNAISWARFETALFSNEMRIYTMILWIDFGGLVTSISSNLRPWRQRHSNFINSLQILPLIMNERISDVWDCSDFCRRYLSN